MQATRKLAARSVSRIRRCIAPDLGHASCKSRVGACTEGRTGATRWRRGTPSQQARRSNGSEMLQTPGRPCKIRLHANAGGHDIPTTDTQAGRVSRSATPGGGPRADSPRVLSFLPSQPPTWVLPPGATRVSCECGGTHPVPVLVLVGPAAPVGLHLAGQQRLLALAHEAPQHRRPLRLQPPPQPRRARCQPAREAPHGTAQHPAQPSAARHAGSRASFAWPRPRPAAATPPRDARGRQRAAGKARQALCCWATVAILPVGSCTGEYPVKNLKRFTIDYENKFSKGFI